MKNKIKNLKNKFTSLDEFTRNYSLVAIFCLLSTTIFWAILSSNLQNYNADQLVNIHLSESTKTFNESVLPAAHTFLIKWPFFILIKTLGGSSNTIAAFSVLFTLMTVGTLAYIIYKLDKRPLVFSTIFLALSSVLLLIPAQPYAGALLPLNMAMLTTRNIEYVFFLLGIYLFLKSSSIKSKNFILSIILLTLLIASDKLFMTLGIGSSIILLGVFSLLNIRSCMRLYAKLLLTIIVSSALAAIVIKLINSFGLAHISGTSSPYAIDKSTKDLGLGAIYGVLALFSNFGANPAFDATVLRTIPSHLKSELLRLAGFAYIVNLVIFAFGLLALFMNSKFSFKKTKQNDSKSIAVHLSLVLTASALISIAAFIFTKHYYPVDGRYLSISLFAIFISMPVYTRGRALLNQNTFMAIGSVLLLSIFMGLFNNSRIHQDQKNALSAINSRNTIISQALKYHKVDLLVGDYWRVLPIKQASNNKVAVMPLGTCIAPRPVLTSSNWNQDLNNHSFAYLLTFDKSLTDFPTCTLDQIVAKYGRPNASVLVAGSLDEPKESLLFYDRGANKSSPAVTLKTPSTVLPIPLNQLPHTTCTTGKTILNFVAHQDDDLLFMNPQTQKDILAGNCIRTVYLTAGDAGGNELYWIGREKGAQNAYSIMAKTRDPWIERITKIGESKYLRVDNPKNSNNISLIFFRLPDGNLRGQGFNKYRSESLEKIEAGKIPTIESVAGESTYSLVDLKDAIIKLINVYNPSEVRTQSAFADSRLPDHSDHRAVSRLVTSVLAENNLTSRIEVNYFMGYPIRDLPPNLSAEEITNKEQVFFTYSKFDGAVCNSDYDCKRAGPYGFYLSRQYERKD